jgi:hypothetical protein
MARQISAKNLLDDQDLLNALKAGGVDNWDWYGDSISDAHLDDEANEKRVQYVSDGHHTFKELYDHRHALFIALLSVMDHAWKSLKHDDGSSFEGYFIAGIELNGKMISYHLPNELWDHVHATPLDCAPEWDGHTPADVVERLMGFASNNNTASNLGFK